jgi:hypothetical protein
MSKEMKDNELLSAEDVSEVSTHTRLEAVFADDSVTWREGRMVAGGRWGLVGWETGVRRQDRACSFKE